MNLTKIESINQLKMADKVAITNYNLEEASVSNMILLIGNVCSIVRDSNNEIISVDVTTINTAHNEIKLTDSALKLKSVYVITENKEQASNETIIKSYNERLIKSNNVLIKKLKKAEKLNKKYKAMLIKRFGATEEEINRNFGNVPKEKNKFVTYRTETDSVPYFINNKMKKFYAHVKFSHRSPKDIKCTISVFDELSPINTDKPMLTVEAIARCHKDDNFDKAAGELITYNKAIAKAICKLYQMK